MADRWIRRLNDEDYSTGTQVARLALTGDKLATNLVFYQTDDDTWWVYTGAAWRLAMGDISGAGGPGVSTGDGHKLGTIYVDTTADVGHILVDNAAGANVWQEVGTGGSSTFIGLTDVTEPDYTGHADEYVRVNATEDGLEFHVGTATTLGNLGAGVVAELSDVLIDATVGGNAVGDIPRIGLNTVYENATDIGTPADADRIPIQDDTDDTIKFLDWTEIQPRAAVLTNTTASYTTAEKTKLAGIETGATADQTAKNSVEIDTGEIQLVGDAAAPGNDKLYGTNATGVKGWYDQPSGGGGGAPNCYISYTGGPVAAPTTGAAITALTITAPASGTYLYTVSFTFIPSTATCNYAFYQNGGSATTGGGATVAHATSSDRQQLTFQYRLTMNGSSDLTCRSLRTNGTGIINIYDATATLVEVTSA